MDCNDPSETHISMRENLFCMKIEKPNFKLVKSVLDIFVLHIDPPNRLLGP